MTPDEINQLAKEYSESRKKVADKIRQMNDDIEKVKNKFMHHIRNFAQQSNEKLMEFQTAIKENPQAFESKKLREDYGLKYGYSSTQDKVVIKDVEQTISLIKANLGAKAPVLIKTTESIVNKAVQNLTADERERIGVTIESGQAYVYVKPTDKEMDDLINSVIPQ